MKLLILSDLHHEIWRDSALKFNHSSNRADIVILAGDINTGAHAVAWAADTFPGLPVLYVHGNHEGYGKNLEDMHAKIESACAQHPMVQFLNCRDVVISGVRFLGATLWTDFKLFGDENRDSAMQTAETLMNDYKRIRLAANGYRKLRARDSARLHVLHKSWLEQKLDEPHEGVTVVVTHMAPSMQSIPHGEELDQISAAYASRIDDLVQRSDVWIHGHIHHSLDYKIGKCRVICNPRGYRRRDGTAENVYFDPNLTIDVPQNNETNS